MALRAFLIGLMALCLTGCHQPSPESESLGGPSIPIVVGPAPPEQTFEQNLAQQGARDQGPIDLLATTGVPQDSMIAGDANERLEDVMGRIRNKVEPILEEPSPEEPSKKPLQGPPRAEDSVEQYAAAHKDQDRLRGYKWAKRLAAMDARLCNQGSQSFIEGCRDGMRDDAAEFQRNFQ